MINYISNFFNLKLLLYTGSLCLTFNVISQFNPQNIDSLKLWMNTSSISIDANGYIDSLYDLSGNDNHAHQINSSRRPLLVSSDYQINSHPGLYFDGSNDFLDLPLGSMPYQNYTLFAIVKPNNLSGLRTVFSRTYSSAKFLFRFNDSNFDSYLNLANQSIENLNQETAFLICSNYNNSSRNLTVNQSSATQISQTGVINYNVIDLPVIGGLKKSNGAIAHLFKGQIVEIILYEKSLSQNEMNNVSDYFYQKYAPPVNFSSDIHISYGFCDTTISSPNYYTSYLWSNGSTDSTIIINEPGEYWLEGVDIFGRITRDTVEVIRPPYDDILLQNQIVCFNQPDTITANTPTGNYSFVQWSDGNTNPIRSLNQNESISYTVIDSLGCTGTSNTAVVSIDNSLESISLGVDTSLCSGNLIQLIQSPTNITNWLWNTQDTVSTLSIDTSGVYILNITNDNGCQNSDTIEVTVIGTAPSLSYSIENEICQGTPLNFSENSNVPPGNTIDQVIWNFGELDSIFVSSGAQIFIDSGIYNGFLEVSTLEGCSSKESFDITVHPKPIATFETTNYCPYENIIFSASNSYSVPLEFYQWEFGQNGNTSLDSNPSYSYGLSGNYDVELIAIDTNSCIDTVVQNVYVQPAPVTDISILNPCEYAAWDLTDNSSIADTFDITTYEWNYGDETDSINPVQGKYYENYGEYTVQLILTADNGCMDTSIQNITVHPNPIINYQVGPACKNTWTEFDDLSIIPQGSITATDWLFNLQFEDNTPSASFNFPTTGIQLVALTSTSDQGCIVDTTFTVDVNEELNANFNVNPDILVSDVPISFTNTSVGSDSSYWDFGNADGLNYNNDIQNSITYSSLLNGTYVDITLITVNDFGCRDTISKTLLVNEALYDINLETLFAQDINGFLTVGVQIENLGTIPLESLNLTLKTPENGPIQENWSGSILQGENEIYIFNAQPSAFISDQDATERFVCVEAQNPNASPYLDLNQDNNTKCKNIEGEGLVLLSMFPNPSDQDITISTLLTTSASLEIEFFDQTGRIAYKEVSPELHKGIHSFQIPFSKFEKGVYTVRISDGESNLVNKMIRH